MAFPAVELVWDASIVPWAEAVAKGQEVHGVHVLDHRWAADPARLPLKEARALQADFLVLQTPPPGDRLQRSRMLQALETALEALSGCLRIVLRPDPGSATALRALLDELQGHALGFCWDASLAGETDALADRLHAAVARPGDSLAPLAALGYRWNVAVALNAPQEAAAVFATWADLPTPEPQLPSVHPDVPSASITFGAAWGQP